MRWKLWTLVALLFTSCLSSPREELGRHNGPLRIPSVQAWRGAEVGGQAAYEYLLQRTAYAFAGATKMQLVMDSNTGLMRFVGMADSQVVTEEIGSAIALTEDGYYLTASHCVRADNGAALIVGKAPSGVAKEARGAIVWDGNVLEPSIDLALVYAPGIQMPMLPWSTPQALSSGAAVLCCGAGTSAIRMAGGTLVDAQANEALSPAHPKLITLTMDAPLIGGDSGGPVMLRDGTLAGVIVAAIRTQQGYSALALRPDPAFLQAKIQAHRQQQAGRPTPEAEVSIAGMMRNSSTEAELQRVFAVQP